MQNKLQELTERLYSEGLSKGRKEAEDMKKKAKAEAEEIISKANEEYKSILAKAQKDAEDYKLKVLNEVKMASKQSMHSLKTEIENLLLSNAVEKPLKSAIDNVDFVKQILVAAIQSFNPKEGDRNTLEILLPESLKKELDDYIKTEIQKKLSSDLVIKFDGKLSNGFKIGPKDGGYFISFTEADFLELIGEYMRPKTREFLFAAN